MALIQCRQCEKAFDTDLIPPGAPLLCVYCGFDNGGAVQTVASAGLPPPLPGDLGFAGGPGDGEATAGGKRVPCEWELNWKTNPLNAYLDTFRAIITAPVQYFATLKPFDDYVSLAVLVYINCFIGTLAAMAFQALLSFLPIMAGGKSEDMAAGAIGLGFGICAAFVIPIFSILGLVIGSGISHFFLRAVGGSQKNFDTTFSVTGLSTMSQVFSIVPIVGSLAAMAYSLMIGIGGQAEAHEIPASKAFIAFIIPMLICCCCIGGVAVLVPILAAALGQP